MSERPARVPLKVACAALGLNRSTVYARQKRRGGAAAAKTARKRCPQPRALSDGERQIVLATLASETWRDQPPGEVYHGLLERGEYLCSMSTMYRLLRERKATGERRAQRPAQHHAVPRLRACAPDEVWTWDITKLPTVRRGVYLSLYVVLDLFSRLALAWMVSAKENSALACQLMREATDRYRIEPGSLTIHQDRGAPMTAHTYLDLMSELGISASHSRPRVSNDNPFSESAFKTQKYQPDYPGRFADIVHATRWCGEYFPWYNLEHHHAGLAGFTPEQVHTGRFREIAERKQRALDAQYARHPQRFVRGRPTVAMPPTSVSINPITDAEEAQATAGAVNFPTLTAAGAITKYTLSENQLSKTG